jgi:hypothetical protein
VRPAGVQQKIGAGQACSCACIGILERVLQRKLNLTFRGVHAVDEAELRGIGCLGWRTQAGRVQQIKEVGAKFELATFRNAKVLACGHVEILIAGSALRSDTCGAETGRRFLAVSADAAVGIACAIDFGWVCAEPGVR